MYSHDFPCIARSIAVSVANASWAARPGIRRTKTRPRQAAANIATFRAMPLPTRALRARTTGGRIGGATSKGGRFGSFLKGAGSGAATRTGAGRSWRGSNAAQVRVCRGLLTGRRVFGQGRLRSGSWSHSTQRTWAVMGGPPGPRPCSTVATGRTPRACRGIASHPVPAATPIGCLRRAALDENRHSPRRTGP